MWLRALAEAMAALRERLPGPLSVEAAACTGQMHGTVLSARGGAVGPAILWADRRAAAEARRLQAVLGAARYRAVTGAPASPNHLGPQLLWLSAAAPRAVASAEAAFLPKDWVRWRLGGDPVTDPTDASGTGLFDLSARHWSAPLREALGAAARLLPAVVAAPAAAGRLSPSGARILGLPAGLPLVAGAGDLPAAVFGAGAGDGQAVLHVGSAGQARAERSTLPSWSTARTP